MTTYTKQVYKDYNFTYKITKEGYWDKAVTKSISSNTTETVTLEPYDGVTVTYGTLTTVSSGLLPDGSAFGGYTGTPSGDYGKNYLMGVDGTSSGTMSLVPGLMFDRDANMIKTYNMFYFADGTIGMTSETSKEGGTWLWSYTGKIALTWAWVANFEQAGDVTYTDNTVSLGRSSSLIANKNTPTISEFFPVTIDLTMKITPSDISGYNILYRDSVEEKGVGFYNGAFRITGGTQGSAVLENSKTYWVRFTQTPETSSFTCTGHYMEDDGTYTIDTLPEVTDSSWTQGFSVSSQLIVSNALFYIGDLENKNDTFKGSIDLESVLMRSGTGSNLTDYWKPLGTY